MIFKTLGLLESLTNIPIKKRKPRIESSETYVRILEGEGRCS